MLSNSNALVTIDSKDAPGWLTPIPLSRDDVTRKDTVFHLISENNVVSVMGTWDEICNYASGIMAAMYSWPLVSGRGNEWFADDDAALQEAGSNGNGSAGQQGPSSNGASDPGEQWAFE